jgi:hypothetical protein
MIWVCEEESVKNERVSCSFIPKIWPNSEKIPWSAGLKYKNYTKNEKKKLRPPPST